MTNGTESNAIILVAMTMTQARAAVPALRHVVREIHDQDDIGRSKSEGQLGSQGSWTTFGMLRAAS